MPLTNPDPLRYPGAASTTGGASTSRDADTTAASSWLQQQPWYKETLASWGNPHTLSLGQRGYLARTAIQAGMNPDFGIDTNGTVEDWSTPTGAKIALAAFAAWAGATELGLLPNGAAAGGSGAAASPTLEATMNAEQAGGMPIPGGEFDPSKVYGTVGGDPGAGSSVPSWLRPTLTAASPFAIKAITNHGTPSGGSGENGLSAEQNDLMTQLIKLSLGRQQEAAPIHQAAMKLAGNLAPTGSWADSPRFQDAVRQTTGPGPGPTTNPAVAAAMQRLMEGRG